MSDPDRTGRPVDLAGDEPTFEAIAARLESIAAQLESGDTELEKALSLFEEGVRLARMGTERLDRAEQRIEKLLQGDAVAPLDVDRPGSADAEGGEAPRTAGERSR